MHRSRARQADSAAAEPSITTVVAADLPAVVAPVVTPTEQPELAEVAADPPVVVAPVVAPKEQPDLAGVAVAPVPVHPAGAEGVPAPAPTLKKVYGYVSVRGMQDEKNLNCSQFMQLLKKELSIPGHKVLYMKRI